MTGSQQTALLMTVLTVIAAVLSAVLPHLEQLPEGYRYIAAIVSAVIAALSAVKLALSQSLHPGHVSIPVAEARRLGVADSSPTVKQ